MSISNQVIPLDHSMGEPCLACPVCGDNYVHPTGIICLPPGGNGRGLLKVDVDGIHLDPTVRPTTRGISIAIEFLCEQGHTFAYRLEFHKGQTYVYARNRDKTDESASSSDSTIWRN